jgi:hypothetical protein
MAEANQATIFVAEKQAPTEKRVVLSFIINNAQPVESNKRQTRQ